MVLPIDAIVPIYYSASVNHASSNNQAMCNPLLPPPQKPSTDKRFWEHFDITAKLPGLDEVLVLTETVTVIKRTSGFIIRTASEALGLGEGELRKVIPYIGRNITIVTEFDTINLAESIGRVTKPKITTEVLNLLESIIRKPIPHITETLTLFELVRRRVIRPVTESLTLNDIIKIGGQFVIMIHETLNLAESVKRKLKPSISETLHLSESPLRRVIPHITGEILTLTESFLRKTKISIAETIQVTENHIRRLTGHGMRRFDYIYPGRLITPKRYYHNIKESIKLDEKVETDTSGPSFYWKFAPVWKALGRKTK